MTDFERIFARTSSILFLLWVFLSMAFIGHHRSEHGQIFGWSLTYLFAVIAPFLFLFGLQAYFLDRLNQEKPDGPSKKWGAFVVGLGGLFFVAGPLYFPDYLTTVLPVFAASMLFCLGACLWSGRREWLLSYIIVSLVGLVLFGFELPTLGTPRESGMALRLPRWGDDASFQYLFPRKEPFIGPGGRLRPCLDLRIRPDVPGREDYLLRTNSLGFRNDENFSPVPASDEFRVLNLGDSFPIGYGMNQNGFFGPLLQKQLNQKRTGPSIRVLNAEISDPAYGLYYFQRYGIKLLPRVVLYGLCSNDLAQTYLALGPSGVFEFRPDRTLGARPSAAIEISKSVWVLDKWKDYVYPKASWGNQLLNPLRTLLKPIQDYWLGLAWNMMEFRLFDFLRTPAFHYRNESAGEITIPKNTLSNQTKGHLRFFNVCDNAGFLYRRPLAPAEELYETFRPVLEGYQRTAENSNALFILIFFPSRLQVQAQDWDYLCRQWNLDSADFDLDKPNKTLGEFCRSHGILFCDLTDVFRREARFRNLYLENDHHFNEYGNALAAKAVADFIEKALASTSSGRLS